MVSDIVINGLSTAGKDTFVLMMETVIDGETRVANVSSIDPFRTIPYAWGWRGEKSNEYRQCLNLLKQAATLIDDYPTQTLLDFRERAIEDCAGITNLVIFYHIREPEEINKLKAQIPNLKTLLIRGNTGTELLAVESDKDVLNYKYDCTISNDGSLDDLKDLAKIYLNTLKGEDELEDNSNDI